MKKYFISYNYGIGFGNLSYNIEELTKNNIEDWFDKVINQITKNLEKSKRKIKGIVILNIQEIK